METGAEHGGESACYSHCCQEDMGWLYLLLIDILPVFLPCFAKGAGTAVSGTAEDAKDVLLLPTILWVFVHSQKSLGCSGLEKKILSRVCLILAMYRRSFHIIYGRLLLVSTEVCLPFWAWFSLFLRSGLFYLGLSFGKMVHGHCLSGYKDWTTTCNFWAHFLDEATDFMHKFRKLLQLIQASLPHLHVAFHFHFSRDCYSISI